MPEDDDNGLIAKKYRYIGGGQAGFRNDARSAEIAASQAAGIFPNRAYQTSTTTPGAVVPSTADNPPVPLASGGNAGLISQSIDWKTGQSKTTWGGVPAFRIDIATANITLAAGEELANPLDVSENGVLLGWSIAVNDPGMKITSIIYGDNSTSTTLWDDTIEAISYMGRGLTEGQAKAVAPGQYNYSLDAQGQLDHMWPYLQRYRSTPSLYAMQNNLQYEDYVSTRDDVWLVAVYSPSIKEGYSRVFLNIKNTGSESRMILRLQLSRIKFQPSVQPIYTSATGDYAVAGEPIGTFSDTLI